MEEGIRKQCGAVSKEDSEINAEFNSREELDRCERGNDCYAMRILVNRSDLLHEKSQLEIEISKRGDACSIQKFHCEFYYIEYYWVAAKRYTRENCTVPL